MYCMYCGHKIGADARFCPMCGERQERPGEELGATVAQAPAAHEDQDATVAQAPAAPLSASPAQDAPMPSTQAAVAETTADLPGPASAAPEATQAMPLPEKAAFVPTAVPGRGPSSTAARAYQATSRPHQASPYREAPTVRAAAPRGPVVAAVVLAAFAVLAAGVFVFGRLGSATSVSSATDAEPAAQTQAQSTTTTTTTTTVQSEPDSDKGDSAQEEIDLDGLSVSGDDIVYVNPSFGYTVTLPASFKAVAALQNGEGASFEDPETGIRVDVSAGRNNSGATVESVLAEYTGAYDVSYQASGSSWLVASWEDDAGDYYAKEYVGQSYVTRILYSTPTASHETGSQLIEDTVNGFKPGSL